MQISKKRAGLRLDSCPVFLPKKTYVAHVPRAELIESQKVITLAPLCLTTLEGDLVDFDSLDLDIADEDLVCVCRMHARVGRGNFFSRLFNYRHYVDIAPVLLSDGLAACLEEDQRVMLACGGLEAMEPLLRAEHEARISGSGLWAELQERKPPTPSSPSSKTKGDLLRRLRGMIF